MIPSAELRSAGITEPALVESYKLCRRINAAHGKTYFLATLLLPPAKRPYVHALYGFARHVDDIIDVARDPEQFTTWSKDFLADLDWGATSDPVSRALLDTAERWSMPHRYFADFLDAMRMDLTVSRYDTFDDLQQYMWGSAGVIGLQMLPILGRASEATAWDEIEPHAVDLGIAFQLTNFIRDIAEDLDRGRIYLPGEDLRMFQVDEERLRRAAETGRMNEQLRNLIAWEIERARGLYRSATDGIALVHPTSQDCLRTALRLYEDILDVIEAGDYNVFRGRVSVGVRRRTSVGLAGLRGSLQARR